MKWSFTAKLNLFENSYFNILLYRFFGITYHIQQNKSICHRKFHPQTTTTKLYSKEKYMDYYDWEGKKMRTKDKNRSQFSSDFWIDRCKMLPFIFFFSWSPWKESARIDCHSDSLVLFFFWSSMMDGMNISLIHHFNSLFPGIIILNSITVRNKFRFRRK